jgi:hypothetical protein
MSRNYDAGFQTQLIVTTERKKMSGSKGLIIYSSEIKEIIIRVADKTSVYKNISKTAVNPTAANPVIHMESQT